jgi:hypothetical protein
VRESSDERSAGARREGCISLGSFVYLLSIYRSASI